MAAAKSKTFTLFFLLFSHDAQLGADIVFNLRHNFGIFFQENSGIVPTLAYSVTLVGIPGAAFLNDPISRRQIQHVAFARNAFAEDYIEFRFPEGRSHFVFYHFNFGSETDDPTGYELCIYEDRVEWWVVDMNDNHYVRIAQWGVWYPDPYQDLWVFFQVENTGVPAGNSMISITQVNEKSLNFVDARVSQPDPAKLRAQVQDVTPVALGTGLKYTFVADVSVQIATVVVGARYKIVVEGGAGCCINTVDGAASRITDTSYYDHDNWDTFVATRTDVWGITLIAAAAKSTVKLVPINQI